MIEKNAGVGGTWNETRYPGARVDTPSRGYTHIFGAHFPYSSPFCDWAENQRYFDWVADTFELRDDIVFETEVRALTWDERSSTWEIEMTGPAGEHPPLECRRHGHGLPEPPEDPRDRGHGRRFRAGPGTPLAGPRARHRGQAHRRHRHGLHRLPAGAGARTPGGARGRVPAQAAVAVRRAGLSARRSRRRSRGSTATSRTTRTSCALRTLGTGKAFWRLTEIDPDFDDPHTVSPLNKTTREASLAFLERKLGDRPELLATMTPTHPPWSARAVMVDADVLRARRHPARQRDARDRRHPPHHRDRHRDGRRDAARRRRHRLRDRLPGLRVSVPDDGHRARRRTLERRSGRSAAPAPTASA